MSEECRKLWAGLAADEQLALSRLARSIRVTTAVGDLLVLKGLIRRGAGAAAGPEDAAGPADAAEFFSPIFKAYVETQGGGSESLLWLDEGAAVVWVEGRSIAGLSPLEFGLLRFLSKRMGQVCRREEILDALYPDEMTDAESAASDNRIDSLVRRVRLAVEPLPTAPPRYLLTVRGHGYKLVDKPE